MPEAQIAAEAARTDPDRRDLLDEDEEIDLLSGRESDVARPEPLKDRLPATPVPIRIPTLVEITRPLCRIVKRQEQSCVSSPMLIKAVPQFM